MEESNFCIIHLKQYNDYPKPGFAIDGKPIGLFLGQVDEPLPIFNTDRQIQIVWKEAVEQVERAQQSNVPFASFVYGII